MADAIVKLSEDDTRRAVAAAVAAALTPEVMAQSLSYVLDEMMKPPKSSYGDQRPTMRRLFDDAVAARVKEEVERLVITEPNRSKISSLVQDGITLLFDDSTLRGQMVSGIANAVATKIGGR